MKELRYPLIVSDFDGTLVQKDTFIGEESRQAIEEYKKNGGIFVISTGRLPIGIAPRAKELGLKGLLCCCQGSIIMDIETGEKILNAKLSFETGLEVVKKMEEMGLHIQIYGENAYYSNVVDEGLRWYETATGVKANIIENEPISVFMERNHFQTYKVLAMMDARENARCMEELKACNFAGCQLTKSTNNLIEVINENHSKGTAVEFLSKHYDIPLENVIAIGDQWNDIEMIRRAGLGVAVKNADDALKAQANYVCEYTNNENAVGKIIKQFAYKERE